MKIEFKEVSKIFLNDSATGGTCYNVYLSIKEYVKLMREIYKDSNVFQRNLFDIKRNLVYNKLVRDIIKGVVIPTISIYLDGAHEIQKIINVNKEDIKILDGLQRTNCILYAYQLLSNEIKDEEIMNKIESPQSFEAFLNKKIRLEIWTNMTVNGVLYKMISLNAGQTPMSIEHQFEVLELPLMKELKKEGIKVFRRKEEKERKLEEGFPLSLIVEGVIAYNLEKIFPKKQIEAISFLDKLDIHKKEHESSILKTDIFMEDLLWVLDDLHIKISSKYEKYKEFRNILSEKATFLIPLMAALGKIRHGATSTIDQRKKILINLLDKQIDDPLDLKTFDLIIKTYRSGIGMKTRRLVFNTFNFFFRGGTDKLDWGLANDMT